LWWWTSTAFQIFATKNGIILVFLRMLQWSALICAS
jgi:hypothetical protein